MEWPLFHIETGVPNTASHYRFYSQKTEQMTKIKYNFNNKMPQRSHCVNAMLHDPFDALTAVIKSFIYLCFIYEAVSSSVYLQHRMLR